MIADEDLVVRLARGESRALDALLVRYQLPLVRFIHRRTGGRDVDDLFQETWLRVVRASERFAPDKRFSTWLFQIAVNVCRDWWRARSRAPALVLDGERSHRPQGAVDDSVDVQRLLEQLPDEQREVVVLRYLHDLSERDAAEILGCPLGTVKSRLHNALATMARLAGAPGAGVKE